MRTEPGDGSGKSSMEVWSQHSYLCSEFRAGMVGHCTEITLGSLVLEVLSLSRANVPNGCMELGTLGTLYCSFWFHRPRRAPPAAQDESLQQPRPDPAEQRVWCLRPASCGHRSEHGLLAVHGGGDRFAAEPDHRGQDGAARWPLESLLLCR